MMTVLLQMQTHGRIYYRHSSPRHFAILRGFNANSCLFQYVKRNYAHINILPKTTKSKKVKKNFSRSRGLMLRPCYAYTLNMLFTRCPLKTCTFSWIVHALNELHFNFLPHTHGTHQRLLRIQWSHCTLCPHKTCTFSWIVRAQNELHFNFLPHNNFTCQRLLRIQSWRVRYIIDKTFHFFMDRSRP